MTHKTTAVRGACLVAVASLTSACGHTHVQPPCHPETVPPGPRAATLAFKIEHTYEHDSQAFTEGLFWHDGLIYESTGRSPSDVRTSEIGSVTPKTKWVSDRIKFGEGIALRKGKIFELTWTEKKALVWDVAKGTVDRELDFSDFGWGLTYDESTDSFIASDGTPKLIWRAPTDLRETNAIVVKYKESTVCGLNELELVGDSIWANAFQTTAIYRIDRRTGDVTGFADLSGLAAENDAHGDKVLNGIAYVPERGTFLITGKYWSRLYEGKFVETSSGEEGQRDGQPH